MNTARIMRHVPLVLLILLPAACILSQCSMSASRGFPITVYAKSITLEWDAPWGAISTNFANVAGYNIYYKAHFGGAWVLVKTVPLGDPTEAVITHDQVGNGAWDFAVSMTSTTGQESDLHTSLDDDTRPPGGWYVLWNRSGSD
jgi:hypothetical protein